VYEKIMGLPKEHLDYPYASATLMSFSGQGMQQQTAFAIRSVIAAIAKRLMKKKQKPPR